MLDPELLGALPFALRAEIEENVTRKNFTQSELAEAQRLIIEHWSALRRQRQGMRTDLTSTKNFVEVGSNRSDNTTALVAKLFGESEPTTRKRFAVVDAAKTEPDRFGALVEEIDRTNRIDRAYKLLTVARNREAYEERRESGGTVADLQALAETGYRAGVICSDPPWPFVTFSARGKIHTSCGNHYEEMSLDDICAMGSIIQNLAAEKCLLLMWATWPLMLPNSFQAGVSSVISAWGFEYKSLGFLWEKTTGEADDLFWGNGYWTRSNTEPVLLATRGNPSRLAFDVHQVVRAPNGRHSEKPNEVYRRIERLAPGPYLELFARRQRLGWTCWGDEIPS